MCAVGPRPRHMRSKQPAARTWLSNLFRLEDHCVNLQAGLFTWCSIKEVQYLWCERQRVCVQRQMSSKTDWVRVLVCVFTHTKTCTLPSPLLYPHLSLRTTLTLAIQGTCGLTQEHTGIYKHAHTHKCTPAHDATFLSLSCGGSGSSQACLLFELVFNSVCLSVLNIHLFDPKVSACDCGTQRCLTVIGLGKLCGSRAWIRLLDAAHWVWDKITHGNG